MFIIQSYFRAASFAFSGLMGLLMSDLMMILQFQGSLTVTVAVYINTIKEQLAGVQRDCEDRLRLYRIDAAVLRVSQVSAYLLTSASRTADFRYTTLFVDHHNNVLGVPPSNASPPPTWDAIENGCGYSCDFWCLQNDTN